MGHEMGMADQYQCPHKVSIPPSKPFFKVLKSSMKETFFPDDPFRNLKNQSVGKKILLGLQYYIPILEWAPRYTFSFFKADLIAGITIASLAVPQGISYANLANLPPIMGLCKYIYNQYCPKKFIYILTASLSFLTFLSPTFGLICVRMLEYKIIVILSV